MGRLHRISEAVVKGKPQTCSGGFDGTDIFHLVKTLQAYLQFKEIPRKVTVAKRLSQCLNPALPTGVHQRALDVYTHILGVIGVRIYGSIILSTQLNQSQVDGLRRDLFLWTSGLFPFFEYSATAVKVCCEPSSTFVFAHGALFSSH